jgi:hypothetical protein
MRFPALLFAILLGCSLLSYGSETTPADESEEVNLPNHFLNEAGPRDANVWREPLRQRRRGEYEEPVCFMMRSYVMQREEPGSEVTRPVKYRECQPSWKFEYRSAAPEGDR